MTSAIFSSYGYPTRLTENKFQKEETFWNQPGAASGNWQSQAGIGGGGPGPQGRWPQGIPQGGMPPGGIRAQPPPNPMARPPQGPPGINVIEF